MNPIVQSIRVFCEEDAPLTRYVFRHIFFVLGLPFRFSNSRADADICYAHEVEDDVIHIPIAKTDLIWQRAIDRFQLGEQIADRVVAFDIINAIGQLMTDQVNNGAPEHAYDEHQRLRYSASFQGKNNIGGLPLVDIYIQVLKSSIEAHTDFRANGLLPRKKTYAIVLSHDVDRLNNTLTRQRHALVTELQQELKQLFGPRLHSPKIQQRSFLRKVLLFLRSFVQNQAGVADLKRLCDVLSMEKEHGFYSVLFFSPVSKYEPHASKYDVGYYIHQRILRRVFLRAAWLNRFEIGLHASYYAYTNTAAFRKQIWRVFWASGRLPIGNRHHYWHLGMNSEGTLLMHEQSGLQYDSSIAFNDMMAFRRSIAHPYLPWYHPEERALRVWQLPVFGMDAHLANADNEMDATALQCLIARTERIRAVNGIGVLDWHSDSASKDDPRYGSWGKCYEDYLGYLASDSDVWVVTPRELIQHLNKRLRGLTSEGV